MEGVVVVSITETPPVHVHRPHINVWLVAVIGLAAGLIALGSWVLVDRFSGGGSVTHDATTLIDEFNAAGNAHDANAAAALFTSDAVMRTAVVGETIVGAEAIGRAAADPVNPRSERAAPVVVDGDFATTFIRFGSNKPVVVTFQLKDGKIIRIWAFEPGVTPPLNNAVTP